MRLIDADELKENNRTKLGNVMVVEKDIDNEPTVDAIPVEWILKWACEFCDPNSEGYKMAMELIHDWEKENDKTE